MKWNRGKGTVKNVRGIKLGQREKPEKVTKIPTKPIPIYVQGTIKWKPNTCSKWQWNLFYSKVIPRSINTFIPLGDETINSSFVERGRSLMHSQPHPPCTSSSEWNQRPRMSFFRSPKMWKSQGERSGQYEECWSVSQPSFWSLSLIRLAAWGWALSCKRMVPSDSIPGRLDTSLLFFAFLHFQYWTNTLYTTLTSRAIKEQLCGPVSFHYACLLPKALPAVSRNVFYGGCSVFICLPLIRKIWFSITNLRIKINVNQP